MADYESPGDRTYYKEEKTEVKFGKWIFGGADWSGLESCGEQRMGSLTACEKHQDHVFQAGDKGTNVTFLGTETGFSAGIDPQSSDKEGHVKSAEVIAKATLIEQKTGPVAFHLGAGKSTGVKEEDGTTDVKFAGCRIKFGKKIGFSVFDNEISIGTAFVG